ncbi:hypothetical protein AM501_05140 [Aneurinibacillus migulanus]|uniref:hypothetical protein n=1 Tax=Aneurinibacillus migulanus TaxID=47500 RepID=UPI0006B58055|nr:hypothetical protein [Aneurinibacillus migulanus]KPD09285.1 hypothetical protein AM501_05140 [Aneurinibacillus migulanus]MCP1359335.1 hypothetical protein [Aneurinibacillus migulanus]
MIGGKKAVVQEFIRCGEKAFPYAFSRYESEQNSKIDIACELLSMVPKSSFSTQKDRELDRICLYEAKAGTQLDLIKNQLQAA